MYSKKGSGGGNMKGSTFDDKKMPAGTVKWGYNGNTSPTYSYKEQLRQSGKAGTVFGKKK